MLDTQADCCQRSTTKAKLAVTATKAKSQLAQLRSGRLMLFVFPVVWSSAWSQRCRCSADDSSVQRQRWKMSAVGIGTKIWFGVRKLLLEMLMPDDGASTNFCAFQVRLSGSCRVHATCEEKHQTGSASYWGRHRKSKISTVTIHRGVQPFFVLLW